MPDDAVARAVNFAILAAHRLGEPRVLELSGRQLVQLRRTAAPADWSPGPPLAYRGLRVVRAERHGACVLAWDRAREMQMTQPVRWPATA